MPYKYLSFSSADMFQRCERQYYFEKVEGRKQPPNATLLVGQAYHKAIACKLHSKPWSLEDAEKEELVISGVNVDGLIAEVAYNLTRIEPLLVALGAPEIVEQEFADRSIGYRGVIDAVFPNTPDSTPEGIFTGTVRPGRCVVDWKSLTSDRRRSQRDTNLSPQLAQYAIERKTTAAAFVELPRDTEKPVKIRVATYTENELENWRQYMIGLRQAIISRGRRKENFKQCDRKNNPLCSELWCPHYSTCYPTKEET
jgi:hypothetical protein